MLETYRCLQAGDEKQMQAYEAIMGLNVLYDLQVYKPVLCGTFPLGIHVAGSDLDIILQTSDLERLEQDLRRLYSHQKSFALKRKIIRGREVVKVNFYYQLFAFELFAQDQPVYEQYAYLHMVIEDGVLGKFSEWKGEVIRLKQLGMNTEAAFCKLLGLSGDPFEQLILYGKRNNIIS
ncbi:DUF4269 domain-containing protein [Virgibacillus pantothenticus]|uniref:DUF4269 domain-containing protein n=1 Tax=Virgibacillus pantothenticus TaxID=1473 RepID=UPI003D2B8885